MTNNKTNSKATESTWFRTNDSYDYRPVGADCKELPAGIYELKESVFGLYLDVVANEFALPAKTYPINQPLLEKILSSWEALPSNLGVLLSGRKGTGKSVLARQIANGAKCPVVVINSNIQGFESYISNRPEQNIVLMIDEIEKHWNLSDAENGDSLVRLLSLLDGTQKGFGKLLTVMTANTTFNLDYLLDRPGRVRYHKDFNQISQSDAEIVIDDLLVYKEFKEDLLSVCEKIDGLTIDAVMTITTEVNLYKKPASILIEDLNLTIKNNSYIVTMARKFENSLGKKFEFNTHKLSESRFTSYNLSDSFRINGQRYGTISEVISDDMILLEVDTAYVADEILQKLEVKDEISVGKPVYFLVKVESTFSKSNDYQEYRNFLSAV